MEKRKHLKWSSIAILALAVFTLLELATEIFLGELNNVEIPEGSPANILLISQILLLALAVVFTLPSLYVGFKGLKMAKAPTASKAHIVWAKILFVIAVLSLVSPILGFINKADGGETIGGLLSILFEIVVYFDYIKHAKAVREEAKGE